jgi:hypothetical protein
MSFGAMGDAVIVRGPLPLHACEERTPTLWSPLLSHPVAVAEGHGGSLEARAAATPSAPLLATKAVNPKMTARRIRPLRITIQTTTRGVTRR